MATKFVTTGENASIFHDQTTGITVIKGQTKELNQNQLNSKRIRNALSSGHLIYTQGNEVNQAIEEDKVKTLVEKFNSLYKSGVDSKKIAKMFNMVELTAIAKSMEIEAEKGDTESTLVTAIIEEISSKDKNKK